MPRPRPVAPIKAHGIAPNKLQTYDEDTVTLAQFASERGYDPATREYTNAT